LLSAWAGLQGALAGAVNPPTVNAAGAVTGGLTVEDLYRQVLGREGRSGGVSFWKNAFGDSVDADEIRSFLKGAEAELAAKAAGTWQHFLDTTGSGPPIYAPPQAGVVGDTSALLTELQTLNTRMMNVEKHTGQFATQFDDATGGGGPLLVTQA
jgi:hypothetical protein